MKNKLKYKIGQKVTLLGGEPSTIYIVYAVTLYKERVAYTIWKGSDYDTVAEWQIKKYNKENNIGFTISPTELGVLKES